MRINDVVGLLAALIGTTATLLGAWGYLRSQHPPKKEMAKIVLVILLIVGGLLGIAVAISQATTITVNGQQTLPIPGFPAPAGTTPTSMPTWTPEPKASPSSTHSPTAQPSPSSVSQPKPSPTQPAVTPAASPTSVSPPTQSPRKS